MTIKYICDSCGEVRDFSDQVTVIWTKGGGACWIASYRCATCAGPVVSEDKPEWSDDCDVDDGATKVVGKAWSRF